MVGGTFPYCMVAETFSRPVTFSILVEGVRRKGRLDPEGRVTMKTADVLSAYCPPGTVLLS